MNIHENVLYTMLPDWFPKDRLELKDFNVIESTDWDKTLYPNTITLYFEEKDIPPSWYKRNEVKSKWFVDNITISDLPVRNNFLKLKIKRRRRTVIATGEIIKEEIDLTELGTKNTKELSFFLK